MKRGMTGDYSWGHSAQVYQDLYLSLLGRNSLYADPETKEP